MAGRRPIRVGALPPFLPVSVAWRVVGRVVGVRSARYIPHTPNTTAALRFSRLIPLGFLALALLPVRPAAAQARPTASQAEAVLKARPELVSQLQARLAGSGLSPEQIRARLRAEGYPESLLDQYMNGQRSSGDAGMPSDDVFSAVRALGLVDEQDYAELLRLADRSPSTLSARTGQPDRATAALRGVVEAPASERAPEIFGLALFRQANSLFLPNLDGPVDAGYRLGPGDQLVLILTGDVELAHTLEVTREGFIVIPQVGQIGVANLTLGQLEDLLYTRLGRAYSGVRRGADATTRFSLSVSRLRSNQIFVAGDVMMPGSYRVTSAGTALTALYAAGGPSDDGSLRRVEVRRGGALVSTLDVYDYLLRGDGSRDVRLQQGDVVFVAAHQRRARVDGQVTRPAIYELKDGETLTDLVKAAGGLTAQANSRRLIIERILPAAERSAGRDRGVIEVALEPASAVPAIRIEDGDVVRVATISDRIRGSIAVRGHVWTEGRQGFAPGLTLEQALRRAGGLKPDGYVGTVLVSRLNADSTRMQLRAILRDTTGATLEPFLLSDDDEITVYSLTSMRPDRYVSVSGSVRNSGRFPWKQGMTIRDLVLTAGGVQEWAFLREAEIARISVGGDTLATAITVRVPIDSSYRFDQSVVAGIRADAMLEPYDNVLLFRDPSWTDPRSVILTGEVRFPARYTLKTKQDRLSDVIARAGGLTPEADANGTYFARLEDTSRVSEFVAVETRRADGGTTLSPPGTRIRVGVDLPDALRGRRQSDNLVLLDGDSIHVPRQLQTVAVRGAVNAPTALAHADRRLGYYIGAAGGSTERARTSRAYVIQPNGKIQSRSRFLGLITIDPKPMPGATVVVPSRGEQRDNGGPIATLSVVTQILASLATIVVLTR